MILLLSLGRAFKHGSSAASGPVRLHRQLPSRQERAIAGLATEDCQGFAAGAMPPAARTAAATKAAASCTAMAPYSMAQRRTYGTQLAFAWAFHMCGMR